MHSTHVVCCCPVLWQTLCDVRHPLHLKYSERSGADLWQPELEHERVLRNHLTLVHAGALAFTGGFAGRCGSATLAHSSV